MEKIINQDDVYSEDYGIENIFKPTTDNFIKTCTSLLFPERIIKRIVYRPYLGKWYPYLDIFTPNKELQLTYFYGPINIVFTSQQICALCGKSLDIYSSCETKNNGYHITENNIVSIPISLCKTCRKKIYYNYWECFSSVIRQSFQNCVKVADSTIERNIDTKKNRKNLLCENFLEPRCGYPKNSEGLNPCLENYGIGLVMSDVHTLNIIIAPLKTLRYQIMWCGGLFGVILGRHNRIINLKILADLLPIIANEIRKIILEVNNSLKKSETQKANSSFNQEYMTIEIKINEFSIQDPHERIAEWLILALLEYLTENNAKRVRNFLLANPVLILKKIINKIIGDIDIEVLDLVVIYDKFPPQYSELREYIVENLEHYLVLNNIISEKDVQDNFLQIFLSFISKTYSDNRDGVLPMLRKIFVEIIGNFLYIKPYQLNGLEIYNILTSLGPWLIAKTNLSREPSIINIKDIIGRKIF